MRRLLIASAASLIAPTALIAQTAAPSAPVSPAQGDVSVTIYSDMALVEDVRTIDVPAGISRQEFPDVSASIRPETVTFGGAGIDVVEQNFDYDLLSPEALMRKAEGQNITLVRTNQATGAQTRESARVLAVNGGVVLQAGDHVEILRDDGLPVKVLFDRIPPNLRARPTLSVTLESDRAGARPVTLSYLSSGLGWKADYVGLFDEAKGRMDLQGWVTLTNSSGTAFRNARLSLAAGDLMKLEQRRRNQPSYGYSNPNADQSGDDQTMVGDLYLYPVEGRTTISTNQKKQVSFLDVSGVAATKDYQFNCNWLCPSADPQSTAAVLHFSTGSKGGLGRALPAGVVRIYVRDNTGKARFVGENRVEHTATGSDVNLPTGLAFDVKVHPILDKREQITSDDWVKSDKFRIVTNTGVSTYEVQRQRTYWRSKMRYVVTNQRGQPVSVVVKQAGLQGWNEGTRVSEESMPGEQDGSDIRKWKVEVPAKGKVELAVTYLTSF